MNRKKLSPRLEFKRVSVFLKKNYSSVSELRRFFFFEMCVALAPPVNAVPLSQVAVPVGSQTLLAGLSVEDVDDDLVSITLSTLGGHNDCTLYDVQAGTSGLDSITLTSGGAFTNVA